MNKRVISQTLILFLFITTALSGCDYQALGSTAAVLNLPSDSGNFKPTESANKVPEPIFSAPEPDEPIQREIEIVTPNPASASPEKTLDRKSIAMKLLREYWMYAELASAITYREGISMKELEIYDYFRALSEDKEIGLRAVYRDCISDADSEEIKVKEAELIGDTNGIAWGYTKNGLHVKVLRWPSSNSALYSNTAKSLIREEPSEAGFMFQAGLYHDLALWDIQIEDLTDGSGRETEEVEVLVRFNDDSAGKEKVRELLPLEASAITEDQKTFLDEYKREITGNGIKRIGDWNLFAAPNDEHISIHTLRIFIDGEEAYII
jgi:hypothetical protein